MSDHSGSITTTTTTNTIKALCCAQCESPIASATDLLRHQIPRLESASYPYTLDLLLDDEQQPQPPQINPATENSSSSNNSEEIPPPLLTPPLPPPPNDVDDGGSTDDGECWVYSATNPSQSRFDIVRFGPNAIQRVRVHGEPTVEHTFFPPHPWRMASCKRCSAHLGWSFDGGVSESDGDDDDGDGAAFLGLVLTNLRERRVDEADLAAAAAAATNNPAADDRRNTRTGMGSNFMDRVVTMEEMEQVMELMGGVVSIQDVMAAMGSIVSGRASVAMEPVEGGEMVGGVEDAGVGGEEVVVEEGGASPPPPPPPPVV